METDIPEAEEEVKTGDTSENAMVIETNIKDYVFLYRDQTLEINEDERVYISQKKNQKESTFVIKTVAKEAQQLLYKKALEFYEELKHLPIIVLIEYFEIDGVLYLVVTNRV